MGSHGTKMGKTGQPPLHRVTPAHQHRTAEAGECGVQVAPAMCLSSSAEKAKFLHEFQQLTSSSCHCWWSCCHWEREPVGWSKHLGSVGLVLKSRFLYVLSLFPVGCCLGEEELLQSQSFSCCEGFFPLFSLSTTWLGEGTSLPACLPPLASSMAATIFGEGLLCHLVFFVQGSPQDCTPLYLVITTVILHVAISFFSKLLLFHFYLLAFISSYWWKGSG